MRALNLRAIALVFLSVSLFAGAASAADDSAKLSSLLPAKIKAGGELVIGALMDVPPVDFYSMDGDPTGINPDLAAAVGDLLGVKVSFRQYDFAGLRPALQAGQIDLIWDSMNDTVARQEVLDFIDYMAAPDTLLLAAGNPQHIQSLGDMCGMRVATVRGAAQINRVEAASDACMTHGEEAIELKLFGSAGDGRLQVQTGRVDAFIGNGPVLFYLAKTADDGKTFSALKLEDDRAAYYGIAFRKEDTQLRKAVVTALQVLMDGGEYEAVLRKYGLDDLALSQPLINSAGK